MKNELKNTLRITQYATLAIIIVTVVSSVTRGLWLDGSVALALLLWLILNNNEQNFISRAASFGALVLGIGVALSSVFLKSSTTLILISAVLTVGILGLSKNYKKEQEAINEHTVGAIVFGLFALTLCLIFFNQARIESAEIILFFLGMMAILFLRRDEVETQSSPNSFGASGLLATGYVTLLGWVLQSEELPRLGGSGIALPVSAGLCSLFAGISLLRLEQQRYTQAGNSAVCVALIAVVSLILAQQFPESSQIQLVDIGGRYVLAGSQWIMSVPLSFAIFASAVWVWLMSRMPDKQLGWRVGWICGLSMSMLGLAGGASQAFKLDTFSLRQMGAPMTLAGVIAVLFFGVGLMQISSLRLRKWEQISSKYPIIVALGVCLTTVFLWSAVADQQNRLNKEQNQVALSKVIDAIKTGLSARSDSVVELARRLSLVNQEKEIIRSQEEIQSFVSQLACEALIETDQEGKIKFLFLSAKNEKQEKSVHFWQIALSDVLATQGGHDAKVALQFVSLPNKDGRVFVLGVRDGVLTAPSSRFWLVFSVDDFLRSALDRVAESFQVQITVNQILVYQSSNVSTENLSNRGVTDSFETGVLRWGVSIALDPSSPLALSRQLPWIVLGAGFLLALMLGISLRFAEVVKAKSLEIEIARLNLELESTVRVAAERDLLSAKEASTAVLEKISDAVFTLDNQWRFTFLNNAAKAFIQTQSELDLIGVFLFDVFKVTQGDSFEGQCQLVRATGEAQAFEVYSSSLRRWIAGRVYPDGDGLAVLFHDVTVTRRIDIFEKRLRQVLLGVASGASLYETLERLVSMLEKLHEGSLCAVIMHDVEQGVLRHIVCPHLHQDYVARINGIKPGPLSASCGAAIYMRERIIVSDIAHDIRWSQYKDNALGCGLAACWSEPILSSDGRVLGCIDVYHRDIHAPGAEEIIEVESAASMAGIAMVRAESIKKIEASEQRFRSLFEFHPDAVLAVDAGGEINACNEITVLMFGRPRHEILGAKYETFFIDAQQKNVRSKMAESVRGIAVSYESSCKLSEQEARDVQITNLPIVVHGENVGFYSVLRDLTEIKIAQSKLLERDRFFSLSPVSFLIMDQSCTILQSNDFLPELLGLKQEDFLGKQLQDFLHLDDVFPTQDAVTKMMIGVAQSFSNRCRSSDGRFISMDWNAMCTDAGMIFATGRDVSEERRAQIEERILRRVVEQSPAVLWRWAPRAGWPIVFVSSNVAQWGYVPADLTKKEISYVELIHPDDYPAYIQYVEQNAVEHDGDEFAFVYRIRTKAGKWVWVDERTETVRNEDHSVRYWQGITLDITERQLALDVLHERDEFFRLADEMLCIIAPDGLFVQANDAFTKVLGFDLTQVLGSAWHDLVYVDDKDLGDAAFQRLKREGRLEMFQARFRRAVDGYRWLEWNVTRQPNGQFFAAARDVTEARRVSAELQQALGDLKSRNQELQDFAFVASHDLQEPLRKIQAFSGRVLTRYAEQMDEQGSDYLRRMDSAAKRMQTLIDDLLSYSRVSTRGQPFIDVDLYRIVREVLSDLETSIESTGAIIHVNELPVVMADPTQMRQVFQNLIANALKFRSPDRRPMLTIESKKIHHFDVSKTERDWIRITVKDNGIGFDNAYREQIFAPFQRLHGRSEYEGTGIGLAIVRKIIERHGGVITASSTPAEGACFAFDLLAMSSHGLGELGQPVIDVC